MTQVDLEAIEHNSVMNEAASPPVMKPVGFRRPSEVVGQATVDQLRAAGWEVVRKTTETRRRDKAAVAVMRVYWAERERDSAREWGQTLSEELRHLQGRCEFLYHKAQEAGLTAEELLSPNPARSGGE